jgi:hypothetical protein
MRGPRRSVWRKDFVLGTGRMNNPALVLFGADAAAAKPAGFRLARCPLVARVAGRYPGVVGPLNEVGKFLVLAGLCAVVIGALLWSGFGKSWLGRLPGDIQYTKGNFTLYFPAVTCLLLSLLLTLLFWLFRR